MALHVEDLLTPDEQALWIWMKYVWREAERVIGQLLEIELDEAGMLAAMEQNYTR